MRAQAFSHAFGGGLQIAQIGRASHAGRRAHGDENHLGVGDRLRIVHGELQVRPGLHQQILQMRFVEGHFTALERADLFRIRVDAGDLMTEISQAGPGGQSDIACSKNRNVHNVSYFTTGRAAERTKLQTLMRLPEALLYSIGCSAPKEQEAQIGGSLRQGQHFLAFLGGNDDIFHPGDPAGLLQPLDPPVDPGVRDGDHHHSVGSRGQVGDSETSSPRAWRSRSCSSVQ